MVQDHSGFGARDGSRMEFLATRPGMYPNVLIRGCDLSKPLLCGALRYTLWYKFTQSVLPRTGACGCLRVSHGAVWTLNGTPRGGTTL